MSCRSFVAMHTATRGRTRVLEYSYTCSSTTCIAIVHSSMMSCCAIIESTMARPAMVVRCWRCPIAGVLSCCLALFLVLCCPFVLSSHICNIPRNIAMPVFNTRTQVRTREVLEYVLEYTYSTRVPVLEYQYCSTVDGTRVPGTAIRHHQINHQIIIRQSGRQAGCYGVGF